MTSNFNIFISYSHKNKKWLDELCVHLKPLVREENIFVWSDTEINTGDIWRDEIHKALDKAHCAIILASPELFASDFIASDELPSILRAYQEKGLWVIVLSVSYFSFALNKLVAFQQANDPSRPLASLTKPRRDKILANLAADIHLKIPDVKKTQLEKAKKIERTSNNSEDSSTSVIVENFLDTLHYKKLQKIGNWIFDKENSNLIGSGMHTYVLSSNSYRMRNLKVKAQIRFTNMDLHAIEGVKEMNSALVFGWQQIKERPRYYNFLLSGEDIWFERIGYRGGDTVRDFDHLSVNKSFQIKNGDTVDLVLVFTESHCGAYINGHQFLAQVLPDDFQGRIGFRPWRSQINISKFVIESYIPSIKT